MFNFNNNCCNNMSPTYNCCNQVVNKCYYEDIPHYTNYHTTVVNNCIRRHINIPTFTQSEEVVYTDEYINSNPIYYNQMNNNYNNFFKEAEPNPNINNINNPNINNPFNF